MMFRPTTVAPRAARPTLRRLLVALTAPALLWTTACRQKSAATAPPSKPPEVVVSRVVEREVIDYEEFTGRLEAVQNVEVRARVRGYLDAVRFTDGQEVKAGDLLFEIDPRPFEAALRSAEGQKALWVARRQKAEADVKRYEELVPTGAASAQDLDKARAELGEAVAAIQSADAEIERARLDVEFTKITAPIDGQINRALITKGNLVQSGSGSDSLLTTIVSVNPIHAYFNINERSLLRFREYQRAKMAPGSPQPSVDSLRIPVYLGLATDAGYPHQGVIDFADNRVDPSTGTVRARAILDNSRRVFKPGFFVRVRVPTSDARRAVLVTDRAVGSDQSNKFVYVVDDNNIAQYRAVKLGRLEDDGLRVITDGLQPTDSVIVTGLQRARPGKPVTPQRSEMPRREAVPAPTVTARAVPGAGSDGSAGAAPAPGSGTNGERR